MRVLLLNQCFYPDVVSTAQHLTDLAVGLTEQGHEVTVLASRRGYDDPQVRFPRREQWKGIKIVRLPSLGLGKKSKLRRALDFASYLASCIVQLLFLPRYDVVVAMTSPPLISFLGALCVQLKGGRLVFWVMDLNPDEAVAAGWLKENAPATRILERLLHHSLQKAERIVVLDRFMERRIVAKGIAKEKIVVIPPWSHNDAVCFDADGARAFRSRHELADKFVVMYSGNHSPCHPLDTLLEAAVALRARTDISFCFVGGGSEHARVKSKAREHDLKNVLCLPYQPLAELSGSLSAANLHVVVMGEPFAGILHPCKVYNILTTGIPFLYIGPPESHIADIVLKINDLDFASTARHREVERVVTEIERRAQRSAAGRPSETSAMPAAEFFKESLLPGMIKVLESAPPASLERSASEIQPASASAEREIPSV